MNKPEIEIIGNDLRIQIKGFKKAIGWSVVIGVVSLFAAAKNIVKNQTNEMIIVHAQLDSIKADIKDIKINYHLAKN